MCFVCFTACDEEEKPSTSSGEETPAINEYEFLNKMLDLSYSKITLTITSKFDEETSLTSKYVMSYSEKNVTVDYTVERFNQISLDKPNTEVKSTFTGQAVIENGSSVTSNTGDVVITPEIAKIDFDFKKECFENTELTSLYLKADVKNAKDFMGANIESQDIKVYAEFLDAFYQIKVNYTNQNGTLVEYNYEFTL